MQEATRLVILAALLASVFVAGEGVAEVHAAPGEAAAAAQPAGEPAAAEATPQPAEAQAGGEPAEEGWGDQRIQGARSKAPATGSPYNWRQMAFAGVIIAVTGLLVAWLIRRQTRERG